MRRSQGLSSYPLPPPRGFPGDSKMRDPDNKVEIREISISSDSDCLDHASIWLIVIPSGTHHREPATTPYSCYSVFTDRSIFSLNLSPIQIPTVASVINCNHKHGLMLTCRHDVDMFTWGRIVLSLPKCSHKDWNWPKNIDWSVKMPFHWLIMELQAPSILVMGYWYRRIPIPRTFIILNLPITRTKSCYPLLSRTLLLNSRFLEPIFVPLGGPKNLYSNVNRTITIKK